jgi:hypothetical protein
VLFRSEESDYYIVIVAGRYGTIGPKGKSYTEMEYDYAVEQGVPILGFLRKDIDEIQSKYVDSEKKKRAHLLAFRKKVLSRTCRKFESSAELGMAVMQSLAYEARVRPRTGWVRADQARSAEDRAREIRLQEVLEEALTEIKTLERVARDRSVLADKIPREELRQGLDFYEFSISYRNNEKQYVTENVPISWDDIFRTIGPALYGYIQRKAGGYHTIPSYEFQKSLEGVLRRTAIERVQNRKIEIQEGQVDFCVIHLKDLGYIEYTEKQEDDNSFFRGITLTEYGERYLCLIMVDKK